MPTPRSPNSDSHRAGTAISSCLSRVWVCWTRATATVVSSSWRRWWNASPIVRWVRWRVWSSRAWTTDGGCTAASSTSAMCGRDATSPSRQTPPVRTPSTRGQTWTSSSSSPISLTPSTWTRTSCSTIWRATTSPTSWCVTSTSR